MNPTVRGALVGGLATIVVAVVSCQVDFNRTLERKVERHDVEIERLRGRLDRYHAVIINTDQRGPR